ncbi:MAG: DUF1501 domain-containing protein [Thermogutta sp.]
MLHRRDFLIVSGGILGVGIQSRVPSYLAAAGLSQDDPTADTVVVAIQMAGGNDGLNTVVPYRDDNYHRQRPTLALKEANVIRLQDDLGFHPALRPIMTVWEKGHLAVVQGVGYPESSDDHARGMEIWQTAQPSNPLGETGWLGRVGDYLCELNHDTWTTAPSIFLGQIPIPLTIVGKHQPAVRCQQAEEIFALRRQTESLAQIRRVMEAAARGRGEASSGLFAEMISLERHTIEKLTKLEEVLADPSHVSAFPKTYFGRQLSCLTQLLRADLGIRIYCLDLGGQGPGTFDTHALQAANHGELLAELAQGLASLAEVLEKDGLFDRVVVYTYSEFGRTIRENGRKGTDHGSAAPVFVLGGKVKGGFVGKHPPLDVAEKGGVKHLIDFRSLYATLLDRWLRVPSRLILGDDFPPLTLFPGVS